jgi:homogentisate 1,2-dioxygenase
MSRNWISFPLREGECSRQAHCDFPEGTYEREMGREGFFGPTAHLHHKHPPTGWIDWQGPLRPHAFNFNDISSERDCPLAAPLTLHNSDVKLRVWKTHGAMRHLVRNADGDDLLFIHEGAGHFYCDFGHLTYRDGDYLLIPRGTAWRIEASEPTFMLLIESTDGAYQLPD